MGTRTQVRRGRAVAAIVAIVAGGAHVASAGRAATRPAVERTTPAPAPAAPVPPSRPTAPSSAAAGSEAATASPSPAPIDPGPVEAWYRKNVGRVAINQQAQPDE